MPTLYWGPNARPGATINAGFYMCSDPEGNYPLTYEVFLDGVLKGTKVGPPPSGTVSLHLPSAEGTYPLTFRLTDSLGASTERTVLLRLDVTPPAAGTFTLDKSLVRTGDLITTTFSGWTDANPPLSYQIKINGGAIWLPQSSSTIKFNFPLPDGEHRVTGVIRDSVGNTKEVQAPPFLVDGTPPVLMLASPVSIDVTDPGGSRAKYDISATDALDPAPVVVADPPEDHLFTPGTHTVTVTATDAAGNQAVGTFEVVATRRYVETTPVAQAGIVAGNLIGTELRDAPGFQLTALGTPSVTNLNHLVMTGSARNAAGAKLAGVLVGRSTYNGHPDVMAYETQWRMPLRAGTPAEEVGTGLVWKAFPREPFLQYADDEIPGGYYTSPAMAPVQFGFHGRVAGPGVTSANDDVLGFFSEHPTETVVFAREGGNAPGVPGGKFKSFTSAAIAMRYVQEGDIDQGGNTVQPGPGVPGFVRAIAFTGMLETGARGAPGPGGVTRTDDMGLWFWMNGMVTLSLREGQQIDGRTVRSFVALRGPVGHGRGLTLDEVPQHGGGAVGGFSTTVLITFTDGVKRLAVTSALGPLKLVDQNSVGAWMGTDEVNGILPPYGWGRFLAWSRNRFGQTLLLTTLTGVPSATNSAIVAEKWWGETEVLVRKGDALSDGSTFTSFGAPLFTRSQNFDLTLAFTGKTNNGLNGAWYLNSPFTEPGELAVVPEKHEFFRVAGPAPFADGGMWRKLEAHALPDGMGPLFTAKLRAGTATAPAPGGVTTQNDLGLWAVDSFGTTHVLIREGQTLGGKTVRTFKALTSVTGSTAQSHSFNGKRGMIVWVLATDYTQHLVHFAVP